MMIAEKKNINKNLFFNLFSQLVILALGVLIPRLLMVTYGSETNGLVSTISQIFTYVALLEAGIGNAAINALYKPITCNDKEEASDILSAAKKYYHKVTKLYAVCVVALTLVYPIILQSSLDYITIALVVLFQGLSGVVVFYFSESYKQLLIADGKNYIVSNISLLVYVVSTVTKILLMNAGYNIIVLQLLSFIITCIQAFIYVRVIKKKYQWLEEHSKPKMMALSQRNAFVVHEVSGVVFSSTDVFVLSIFCDLKLVSVYVVYNLVFSSLNSLISSINNGLNYLLGHTFAQDKHKYENVHDAYESLYMAVVFSLFSVAYFLIIPFVSIYTRGVKDIQYIDRVLPLLFVLIQLLSCSRAVSSRLISIGGHARQTQFRSILEAAINIIISVILVNVVGIYGVLLGTIIALLYRTNDIIFYANKKILNRSPWKTYKKIVINFAIFALVVVVEYIERDFLLAKCENWLVFLVCGIAFTLASCVVFFLVAIISDRNIATLTRKILSRKKNPRQMVQEGD